VSGGRSLLRELAFDLGVTQVLGLLCCALLMVSWLHSSVQELEARDMREAIADIADHLQVDGGIRLELSPASAARFSPSYGRYSYVILDGQGQVMLGSNPNRPLSGIRLPEDTERFEVIQGASLLWGVTQKVTTANGPVWIRVAEDMNHQDVLMDELVSQFLSQAVWLLIPVFLGLGALTVWRMRRRLSPIVTASTRAAEIGPEASHVRLPTAGVPAEILPLVRAVNHGLNRLDGALAMQKEFLANASHELRTPLTVLRTRLSLLEEGELRDKLEEDAVVLSRLIGQVLRASELEGMDIVLDQDVDLAQLCRGVASYLAPAAAKEGKTIHVDGDAEVVVRANFEALGQAVSNLVDNALAHTPAGTVVEIEVSERPEPRVRVRDHGPGIPPDERGKIFERFWRKDRSKRSGAGLGLSIVARAVEAHHGRVEVEEAPGGGALFSIVLPAGSTLEQGGTTSERSV